MANITIPPINRPEWKELLLGQKNHQFKNYVLQMKFHQAKKDISEGNVSIDSALKSIYDICSKYALAVQEDFKSIFKTW